MADVVTVKDESPAYTNCPEGVHVAVCVDVIDLGERVESFQGKPPKIVHKLALVYQADEINPDTGKRFELSVEKTVSFGEKAGLRKWLEAWRGKPYTAEQAKAGVLLHKMEGAAGLITVAHQQSQQGRTYAKLTNISPLPKGTVAIKADGYARAEFWTKRREEYAAEVAKFRAAHVPARVGTGSGDEPPPYVPPAEDGDDLPF